MLFIAAASARPLSRRSVAAPHALRALSAAQTAELVRFAALRPRDRLARLAALVGALLRSFRLQPLVAWGVKIAARFVTAIGRLLPSAPLQFGGGQCADVGAAGEWDRARPRGGGALAAAAALPSWAAVSLLAGPGAEAAVRQFLGDVRRALGDNGVHAAADPPLVPVAKASGSGSGKGGGDTEGEGAEARIATALAEAARKAGAKFGRPPVLALVVLPEKGGWSYLLRCA